MQLITLYIISETDWYKEFRMVHFLTKDDSEEEEKKMTIKMFDVMRSEYEQHMELWDGDELNHITDYSKYIKLCKKFIKSAGSLPTEKELEKWRTAGEGLWKRARDYYAFPFGSYINEEDLTYVITEPFTTYDYAFWYSSVTITPGKGKSITINEH